MHAWNAEHFLAIPILELCESYAFEFCGSSEDRHKIADMRRFAEDPESGTRHPMVGWRLRANARRCGIRVRIREHVAS